MSEYTYRARVAGARTIGRPAGDLSTVAVAVRPYLDRGYTVWVERLPPPDPSRVQRDVVEIRPDRQTFPCAGAEPARWHDRIADAVRALG